MERQIKTISKSGIPEALAKVQHYRYLNQAEEAESICRDILAADAENQSALRLLGLSITDQFTGAVADRYKEAESSFAQLTSAYERSYYLGIPLRPASKTRCAALKRRRSCVRKEMTMPFCAGTAVCG